MQLKDKEPVNVLRARLNLTQEELASRAKLSARTIYLFEKDVKNLRAAKYETLEKLAKGLGVTVNDIFLG